MDPFVKTSEARDYVLERLEELIRAYEAGVIGFPEIYYPVMSEPLLSTEEKERILASPSIETIREIRGESSDLVIGGRAVPRNAAIVPEKKRLERELTLRHGLLKSNWPKPRRVISIYRAASLILRKKWPQGIAIFLYIDTKNRLGLDMAGLVALAARFFNIPLYSNAVILFWFEEESITDTLSARLGFSERVVRIEKSDLISTRTDRALRFLCEQVVEERFEMVTGIRCWDLPVSKDWWRFGIDSRNSLNEAALRIALDLGLKERHARKLASSDSIATCANMVVDIAEEGAPWGYVEKAARACSAIHSIPEDLVIENIRRLIRGQAVVWPHQF